MEVSKQNMKMNSQNSLLKIRKGDSMNIDWKHKLTSRKFWAAVIGFVTTIMIAFGVDDLTVEQVAAIISSSATLIAYIIGEGMVDAAKINAEKDGNDA